MQAQRLGLNFKQWLGKHGEGEITVKEMVEKLMRDSVKADKSRLPGICSLDWEFNLSSIFVEVDTPLVNIITGSFYLIPTKFWCLICLANYYLMYRGVMARGALLH